MLVLMKLLLFIVEAYLSSVIILVSKKANTKKENWIIIV